MSDLPPGEWSELLVGHQWPSVASLTTLASAGLNRGTISTEFDSYADVLQSIRTGPLAQQEGVTADDTRDAFQAGETSARAVSEKNGVNQHSYDAAHRSTQYLRTQLSEIAQHGNSAIHDIQQSKDPAPIKLGKIVHAVMDAQTQANSRAASCSDRIFGDIQQVLDSQGSGQSAHQFAKSNGVDLDQAFRSPNEASVRQQVSALLGKSDGATSGLPGSSADAMSGGDSTQGGPGQSAGGAQGGPTSGGMSTLLNTGKTSPIDSPGEVGAGPVQPTKAPFGVVHTGNSGPVQGPAADSGPSQNVSANAHVGSTSPAISADSSPGASQTAMPSTVAGGGGSGGIAAPGATGTGGPNLSMPQSSSLPSTSAPTNALSPEGFAQNFNSGAQAGGPMSSGAEGLSNTAAHAMQPQAPIHPESLAAPPAYTTPSAGAPLFENAHATTTYDAAPAPAAPAADTTQTYMAAPAAQAPVMPSTAAAAPAGPLPAYGADLRPAAAATAPAAPPPVSSAAAPASAPVHPSSGTQLGQPAVVRQAPTAPGTSVQAPTGITESALAATATGAVAGAGAALTQEQQRLQRLLDAVARQEPKLRWAIGDREDGNTALVTDLASGWIPPNIEIPTGVKLLKPRLRSRTLVGLLGETTLTATYTPGEYLPPVEDTEPTQMSIRARDIDEVDELGWELAQATKWRDGLPRLAHTLAKAASTGTGYLDSEVELLRENLAAVASQVLGDYPDHVDAAKVGNWQLLATIDALIKNEKTAANYHFAWFQALSLALKGEVHP
ncbi:hypothetical protein EV580_4296 [Mycobacterium sp. BK086]|nr:hypothetical protein EV580_4296 [Mycobacterium sp. BK086]